MKERRAELRLWCSDLIQVRLEGAQPEDLIANLEDISPSGARVQFEQPVPAGTAIVLKLGRRKLHGEVKYCTHNEIGYFAGVQFEPGNKWSREIYEPKHLLDPTQVRARKQ
ncbi:MAG TPA: PilZ domain-containing protein [Bryobacteraceae bacterium]|nr:PilZ domain-containing protein [Bryobacteraceae bacterium]